MPHTGDTGKGGQAKHKHHHDPPHDTHGDRHKGTTPGGAGGGVTGSSAGGSHGGGGGGSNHPSPVAWVVRRQQILRRAGFNIAVDGVYGPATVSAWQAFRRGISSATAANLHQSQATAGMAIPPGYVRYRGQILPKAQAKVLSALHTVQQVPTQFDGGRAREAAHAASQLSVRRQRDQQLRQDLARSPSFRALVSQAGGRGADLQKVAQHHDRQIQAIDRRVARDEQQQRAYDDHQRELDRIIGVDGKLIRLDPHYLLKAAEFGRLTGHDVLLLMQNGLLDPQDGEDVRVLQHTINHELPQHKIKVDGVYGTATVTGLTELYNKNARQEFNASVQRTKAQLYDTGVAQIASQEVLGHVIDAAELLRILQTGGPTAIALSRSLARHYANWQGRDALTTLQLQKAREMLGVLDAKLDHDSVFRILTGNSSTKQSRALAFAYDINDYQGELTDIYGAQIAALRKQQQAQAAVDRFMSSSQGQPGFFSEMWDAYYNDTPIDNIVDGVKSVYDPVKYGFQRLVVTGLEQYGQYINPAFLNPNAPRGAKSLGQAWQDSEYTISELKQSGGFNALLFDLVVDPVNFVPASWFAKGFGLAGVGLAKTIAEGATSTSRSLEFLDRWAATTDTMHRAFLVPAYHAHVFGTDVSELGLREALRQGDRFGPLNASQEIARRSRVYRMATVVRSEAIRKVNDKMLALMITGLRSVAWTRFAEARGLDASLAAHAEQFHELRALLPNTDAIEVHGRLQADQIDQARVVAPDLVSSVEALGSPLFRRSVGFQSTKLTFAGIRLRAFLLEQARQSIILRYRLLADFSKADVEGIDGLKHLTTLDLKAKHRITFGEAQGDAALQNAGSWFIGGLPHDLYDGLYSELNLMRERVMKQILPMFDDMLIPKLDNGVFEVAMRDGEITLANEASDVVRKTLDDLMGFNVDDAYLEKNWEEFDNPNYGKTLKNTPKERYRLGEITRRTDAVTTYAELHSAIGDTAQDWTRWAMERSQEIDDEVSAAWKFEDGGWTDIRRKIKAPAPTLLGSGQGADLAQREQVANLIDGFLSFDRVPRTAFMHKVDTKRVGTLMDDLKTGEVPVGSWEQFIATSQQLDLAQAITESGALSKAYLQEDLLWYSLREHQARRYRYIYYGTVGSLALWKTATLPMRPAFIVRNVVDNFVKMMLEGFRDPRLFYAVTADGSKSVFQMAALGPMRGLARFIDRLHPGANVRGHLDHVIEEFWNQSPSVLQRIIDTEGIKAPTGFFSKTMAEEETAADVLRNNPNRPHELPRLITRTDIPKNHIVNRFRDAFWEMAVATPEGYQKKLLYVSKYRQAIARGATEEQAMKEGLDTIDKALFDYDNVSVLEENLKVFFPFIFFWRRNAQFWATAVVEKPWFFYKADQVYEAHLESNIDQPEWMRRYTDLSPLASAIPDVPGTTWLKSWLTSGASVDPLNYISIAQFYRAFKNGNQDLPADKQGMAFISNLVDGFNSNGLSINPFLRYAGERFGVLNYRTWQDIFPQTSLLTAFSNTDFIRGLLPVGPAGFDIEHWLTDKIFHDILGQASVQEMTLQNFNYYVQREIAAQVARGEKPDRTAAEAKIRGFLAFQTLVGYNIGVYPRRMTADDIAIDKVAEMAHQIYANDGLTQAEKDASFQSFLASQSPDLQAAYTLYRKNKAQDKVGLYDPAAFDRWAIGAKAAQAFFALDDYDDQQAFLAAHPEVLPIINPVIDDRVPSSTFIRDLTLINDTQAAIDFGYTYLDGIEAAPGVRDAAESILVSPELRAFWAENDTPGEVRGRQSAAGYYHYLNRLSTTYFAIPETDYASRDDYLSRHPELQDWWNRNDLASDDYRGIQLAANSTFREIYFKMVDAGDWDAADIFLRRHSYMFDYTSAEGRISPDGNWLPKSQAQHDYAAVATDLKTYYSFTNAANAAAYLTAHPNVQHFLTKYRGTAGMQDYAADYDKIKAINDAYFALPQSQRAAFLAAHPELKAFWGKYAHERSDSQHARDYMAVKSQLDAYFALPEDQRSDYLSRHPDVKAYFAKYGSSTSHGSIRNAIAADPEIKSRYDFWTHYFSLPPNKRAQFVYTHAEAAGIFVYGSLAGDWRHRIDSEWHRKALRFGTSDRAAAYMSIKPLMDLYFTLKSDGEKALFLQTNPELQVYFEDFGDPFTKNPKLNRLLQQYFRMPGFSPQRAAFLEGHPELRVFFNKDATPRELAIQRLADAYFSMPFGSKRDEYLHQHPELGVYFDQRQHEADLFASLSAAFNETDPRMAEFRAQYADIIPKDAIHRYFLMLQRVDQLIQGPSRDDTGRREDDGTLRRRSRVVQ